MDITQIFESRKNNSKWNTSYPLSPNDWVKYRTDTSLIFNEKDGISYYIHIPFCKKLCSFCEYTRMECPSIELQYNYLVNLEKDVLHFVHTHANMPLRGFDIGGGTPTTLSEENFQFLLNIFRKVIDRLSRNDDFEPSIETTFDTITLNKARMITEAGIRRVSLGIQSTDPNVLKDNHRVTVNLTSMLETIEMLHHAGIEKVNLDLMYGLNINLSWKGFDLNMGWLGNAGVDVFNSAKLYERSFYGDYNTTYKVYEAWSPTNRATSHPRVTKEDPNGNFKNVSSYFVEDGSFFKLKNLHFGYNLPKSILSHLKIEGLKFYINCDNLFIITKFQGDPELGGGYLERNMYSVKRAPSTRTIMGGLSLTL